MNTEVKSRLVRTRASRSVVRHALTEIRELAELSERLLKQELELLSTRVNDSVSCLPFVDQKFERGWFDEDIFRLADIFPRIQRHSIFVFTMGVIESNLDHICRFAKEICSQELSAADLRGKGIARSLDYLTKVCHLCINRNSGSQADHLVMFQKMRNAIVHAEARPTEGDLKVIRQYQSRNRKFTLSRSDDIVLSDHFVPTVIHSAELLFEVVFGELDKKIKIAQQGHGACSKPR